MIIHAETTATLFANRFILSKVLSKIIFVRVRNRLYSGLIWTPTTAIFDKIKPDEASHDYIPWRTK